MSHGHVASLGSIFQGKPINILITEGDWEQRDLLILLKGSLIANDITTYAIHRQDRLEILGEEVDQEI